MRDIKFRGKRIDNNKWVYGFLWIFQKPDTSWYKTHITPKYESVRIEVMPDTVGQFTGQHDKNSKEIYFDSDIVEYTSTDCEEEEIKVTGTVVLDLQFTLSFCVQTPGGALYHFTASELRNVEIIGNITENPKMLLLEEQNNGKL